MVPVLLNADFDPDALYENVVNDHFDFPGVDSVLKALHSTPSAISSASASADYADNLAQLSNQSPSSDSHRLTRSPLNDELTMSNASCLVNFVSTVRFSDIFL